MIFLFFNNLLIDVGSNIFLSYSIIRNVEEFPEGWVLSFDDHPALKKVTLSTKASSRAELRALEIKQLEEIIIDGVSALTADTCKTFTTNNPNIKSLTIKDARLNTERLKYIVTNLVKLEEFEFDQEDYPKLKYEDLRLIFENCRNIKKIDVVLNEEPGKHEIFEEFAEKLKNITLNVKFQPVYIHSGVGYKYIRSVSSPESS